MTESYSYHKISGKWSFRVLKVYGSVDPELPIECDLIQGSVDDRCPDYEAISYCWNGQSPTEGVICEGRRLLVTKNCAAALKRFRPSTASETRLLWIDSICINQADTEERNRQVQIMGTVFNKAKTVLVWLGDRKYPGIDPQAATFEWLVRLADAAMADDPEAREGSLIKLAHELNTADLNEFVNAIPWFKRLWIVQEVVFRRGARLVYGQSQACLDAIMQARALLGRMDKGDGADKRGAGAASMALWNAFAVHDLGTKLLTASTPSAKPDEIALCNFLAEVRFSGATNEKDKILGLYNILTGSGVRLPAPDYTKSVGAIYREATAAMIWSTGSLRILEQVDGLGITEGLVSWAPDWSSSKHSLGLGLGLGKENVPDAPYSEPFFEFRNAEQHLVLKGVVVDAIEARTPNAYTHVDERLGSPEDYVHWTKNPKPDDLWYSQLLQSHPEHSSSILRLWNVRALQSFMTLALNGNPEVASHESVLALYRTLMSQVHPDVAGRDEAKAREWFRILRSGNFTARDDRDSERSSLPDPAWMRSRRYLPQLDQESRILAQLKRTPEYEILKQLAQDRTFDAFHSRIDRIRYKTVFKTASGKIGIAPWSVQAGDKIAYFSGVRMPMVIRPVGQQFRLISQAHVQGLVSDQTWSQNGLELREIVLI